MDLSLSISVLLDSHSHSSWVCFWKNSLNLFCLVFPTKTFSVQILLPCWKDSNIYILYIFFPTGLKMILLHYRLWFQSVLLTHPSDCWMKDFELKLFLFGCNLHSATCSCSTVPPRLTDHLHRRRRDVTWRRMQQNRVTLFKSWMKSLYFCFKKSKHALSVDDGAAGRTRGGACSVYATGPSLSMKNTHPLHCFTKQDGLLFFTNQYTKHSSETTSSKDVESL